MVPSGSELKTRLSAFGDDRRRYVRMWDMCLLFLQGRQNIVYDRMADDFRKARVDGSSVTINLMINIYRNLKSRLSVAYPSTTVLPSSPSAEDVVKAKSSEAALQYYWAAQNMGDKFQDCIGWLLTTGNVGLHTKYNGKDVVTEVITPYNMFFEPGTVDPKDSNWIAYSREVNRKDLEKAYPKHLELIKKSASASNIADDPSSRTMFGLGPSKTLRDRLTIYEVYFKNGERRVLLDSTYLFEGKWKGKIPPLQYIRYTAIPGRLWGLGALEPLIDIQLQYNKSRSQVIDNAELIGNPKWLVPKTAGIGPNAITSRKGEKIYYNPSGGAPTAVTPPSLPGFVLQNTSQLASEMLDVAGVHATTLGKRAIGVTSGKAIEALSGRDMTQLQDAMNNLAHACSNSAVVILSLMKAHYTEPKMVRMMDSLGDVVFRYLKSTDLVEDPEVFIEAGSLFRNEKQDRDEKILEMLQLQLIDKETALRELKFGTGNSFVSKKLQAIAHANDLLMAAASGAAIEIFPTDDLTAFSEVFGDFIQSAEYYNLPEDRQQYIRDVYISVASFGSEHEQMTKQHLQRTVFPPQAERPAEAMDLEVSLESPVAALQAEAEFDRTSSLKMARQMMDGDGTPEQGLRTTRMGGGG
jgi:hypothetical protein